MALATLSSHGARSFQPVFFNRTACTSSSTSSSLFLPNIAFSSYFSTIPSSCSFLSSSTSTPSPFSSSTSTFIRVGRAIFRKDPSSQSSLSCAFFSTSPTKWGDHNAKEPIGDLDLDRMSVEELLNLGRETSQDVEEDERIEAVEEWQRLRKEREEILAAEKKLLEDRSASDSDTDFSDTELVPRDRSGDDDSNRRRLVLPMLDAKGRAYGTGKRKTAIAQVWIGAGDGKYMVNNVPHYEYFKDMHHRVAFFAPFCLTESFFMFDVWCHVKGGGPSAQAQAIQLGINRALINFNPQWANKIKKAGLTKRDPRKVERKKVGQKKARKKFQWVKR